MKHKAMLILFVLVFASIGSFPAYTEEGGAMKIKSPEFENNGSIPSRFTCEGEDISPELIIEGVPQAAKSLALIMDDPDASMGTWVHWAVFNMPVVDRIKEDSVPGTLGTNTAKKLEYHGPCPPSGTHRYFFKIYALDCELDLQEGASKGALEKAMQGHIVDKAELIGLYKRGR